ncbi:alpha/beta fold hydrolase [Halomicrobium salinisoli]|uniref:alpha/beta fold hydrolase n=1 Tax=Halomicrobium salinisoli TaxID=2878391 RepID=UPI001CF07967|nr:alpha/beta hydrolase [Halomicrobium salinisoli]
MQTVTSADGTRIAYERHGEGQPLVLLHGDATRRFWDPVVQRLADDYTVVVPDRRGRGDSGDGADWSLEREVEDARAVVETADDDPVLFGHSFGGLQAIELTRTDPVAAVVAYEPSVIVGEYRETADLADRMEAALDAGDPERAARLHLREVLHGGEIGDAAFEAWLDDWPLWPEYVRFADDLYRMDRAIERYELPDELGVDAPALLLTGTEGPAHLRESVRAVQEALPDGRLVEFEGVGHAGPAEAPERVASAVGEFLADVAVTDPSV